MVIVEEGRISRSLTGTVAPPAWAMAEAVSAARRILSSVGSSVYA